MKKLTALLIGLFLSIVLINCGGGSSGGAGGGTIVLNGTARITLSSPGVPSEVDTYTFTMKITGNQIEINDGEDTWVGTINPDGSFSITKQISGTEAGLTCSGPFTWSGTVTGGNGSGTNKGTFTCTLSGRSVTINLQGTWAATDGTTSAVVRPASSVGALLRRFAQ